MSRGPNQVRNVCATIFHDDPDASESMLKSSFPYRDDIMKYMVCGVETCPDTQRLHLQVYFQLKQKKTISFLKKELHAKAHFESAKGSYRDNFKYCTKEGNWEEYGDFLAMFYWAHR